MLVNVTRQNSGCRKKEAIKNSRSSRRQGEQVSKLMIFSLVVMIAGFIMATPLSLMLTIPAYILADKVSYMYVWHGRWGWAGIPPASLETSSYFLTSMPQSPPKVCYTPTHLLCSPPPPPPFFFY